MSTRRQGLSTEMKMHNSVAVNMNQTQEGKLTDAMLPLLLAACEICCRLPEASAPLMNAA